MTTKEYAKNVANEVMLGKIVGVDVTINGTKIFMHLQVKV